MSGSRNSTIVRIRNRVKPWLLRGADHVAPARAGRMMVDLWFAAPPRMPAQPVPPGGTEFTVQSQGATVRGLVWEPPGATGTVYLVHGWGGRGSQLGAMVEPLVASGRRVVTFDGPSHGDSDHGPAGPRRTSGVELARALDDVAARFGPAEAVVAHSLGTIATYLALRFGWLGVRRLVLVAPMVESVPLVDQFQAALGFGPRTRREFERAVRESVGIPLTEFDARVQAAHSDPLPTLVVADRADRQTPHAAAADLARAVGAQLVTTDGLGHRRILRDPAVVGRVVDFVVGRDALEESA